MVSGAVQEYLQEHTTEVHDERLARTSSEFEVDIISERTTPDVLELPSDTSYELDALDREKLLPRLSIQPDNTLWAATTYTGSYRLMHRYEVAHGKIERLETHPTEHMWVAAWPDEPLHARVGEQAPEDVDIFHHTGATALGTLPATGAELRSKISYKRAWVPVVIDQEIHWIGSKELATGTFDEKIVDELQCVFHGVQLFTAKLESSVSLQDKAYEALITSLLKRDVGMGAEQTLYKAIKNAHDAGVDVEPFLSKLDNPISQAGLLSDIGRDRRDASYIQRALYMVNDEWEQTDGFQEGKRYGSSYRKIISNALIVDEELAKDVALQICSPMSRVRALTRLAIVGNDTELLDAAQTVIAQEVPRMQRQAQLRKMHIDLWKADSDLRAHIFPQLSGLVQKRLQFNGRV